MLSDESATTKHCHLCRGTGTYRNGRYFFYAVSLSASAVILSFQWPPTPALVEAASWACERLELSHWLGEALIRSITAIPAIFGVTFFYVWLRFDACPRCKGWRHKVVLSEETRRVACMN
jgi:hypothetical protein